MRAANQRRRGQTASTDGPLAGLPAAVRELCGSATAASLPLGEFDAMPTRIPTQLRVHAGPFRIHRSARSQQQLVSNPAAMNSAIASQ